MLPTCKQFEIGELFRRRRAKKRILRNTNIYHSTVLSIFFHKFFVSLKLDATCSQAENLLKIAGLDDDLINSVEESDVACGGL